jgi:hypothetical protein
MNSESTFQAAGLTGCRMQIQQPQLEPVDPGPSWPVTVRPQVVTVPAAAEPIREPGPWHIAACQHSASEAQTRLTVSLGGFKAWSIRLGVGQILVARRRRLISTNTP